MPRSILFAVIALLVTTASAPAVIKVLTPLSKVVTPVAQQKKAVVKAEVVTAGIVRASTDTVVTIVYVNQVTTSSLSSGPKVDLSRVRMTLERVGGHWLVSKVDAL